MARLEETRRLEQTMNSDLTTQQQPEPAKPGSQATVRMGQPTPMIPAHLLATNGTVDLTHTQESVKIPPLKLNKFSTTGVPPPQ